MSRKRPISLPGPHGDSQPYVCLSLGALSKLRKATISFFMSVLLSFLIHVCTTLGPSHVAKTSVRLQDNTKGQNSFLMVCFFGWQRNFPQFSHKIHYGVLHWFLIVKQIKLLKTKRNLLYIRNQFVPRSKHFSPLL